MIDSILSQEDQEFEGFVSLMQDAGCGSSTRDDHTGSNYESDDEEFEQLLMDVISKAEKVGGQVSNATSGSEHGHDMDVSAG